jgi:hypothetical protein
MKFLLLASLFITATILSPTYAIENELLSPVQEQKKQDIVNRYQIAMLRIDHDVATVRSELDRFYIRIQTSESAVTDRGKLAVLTNSFKTIL